MTARPAALQDLAAIRETIRARARADEAEALAALTAEAALSPLDRDGISADAATLVGLVLSGSLVAGAIAYRRRWPDWSLAVLWMGAALTPSSSIVPLQEMVVDHRAYLGGAGICLIRVPRVREPARLSLPGKMT